VFLCKCSKLYLYFVLFCGAFIAGMSISSIFPVMEDISSFLKISANYTQMSFPVFLFSFAFAQLFYGYISDRFGRRIPYLLGCIFFIIGSLLCYNSNDIFDLLIGRFIQGAGIGCTMTLAVAIFYDIHVQSFIKVYTGLLVMILLGSISSPVIMSFVSLHWMWQYTFLGFAALGAVLFVLALIFVPETHSSLREKRLEKTFFIKSHLKVLTSRSFIGYLLISCLLFSMPLIVFCTMPVLLVNTFNLSMFSYTWLSMLNIGFYLFGLYLGYLIADGISYNKIIFLSTMMITFGAILGITLSTLTTSQIEIIYLPTCVILLGAGLGLPSSLTVYTSKLIECPGTCASIQLFSLAFIASCINFLNAILHENDQVPLMAIFLIVALATLFILWLLHPKKINI